MDFAGVIMKQNIFIKRENGLIRHKQLSYEQSIDGWEKIPDVDDLEKLQDEQLTNAIALIAEFDAYENGTAEYAPENLMTYAEKRRQPIAKGGYGTCNEQLEIMNEQGFEAWQAHCAEVKTRFPK
jgi:hypothetical protein